MNDYEYNGCYGTHTIRTEFQSREYKGFLIHNIGGNSCGGNLLEGVYETITWIKEFEENNCKFKVYEDGYFTMTLVDVKGNELLIEDEINNLSNYIVALKIIDYRKDEEK